MSYFNLSPADWAILVVYLAIIMTIGAIAARRVKGTEQYFLGNRRFGRVIMIAQSFGTGTHAEMPVSLAGAVYAQGFSAIWFQWKNLFVTPFYWILAPLFRRFRRTTMGEVVEDRYGTAIGTVYVVFALLFFTLNLGSMLKGAAKVIVQASGAGISADAILVGMAVIFVSYTLIGGLLATAWTELVQGFLIITLSFLLIPLGWGIVGGLDGMREVLGPDKISLTSATGIGIGFIAVLTLNGFVGIVAQPHLIAAVGTGKDEHACRVGQVYGNMVKRVCTAGWAVVGLIAAVLVAQGAANGGGLVDPEDAFGFACRKLLFPGGIGLLVASLLAANMAGCSSFMVSSGAMVTNSLYRRHFKPNATDAHYLRVGRISGLVVTTIAVLYAVFFIERVLYSFLLTETVATYFGVSILGGIIWRRANRWGAGASIVAAVTTNFAAYAMLGKRLDHWDPRVFMLSLGMGVLALVIVSLLTPPEPATKTEQFYKNLQTPSNSDEKSNAMGPASAAAGTQLLLPNVFSLRKESHGYGWRAYRADLTGLCIGMAIVLSLVAVVWAIMRFA